MIDDHLGKITVRMTSTLEVGEVLAAITRGLVEELDAALARVWLLAGTELTLAASAGLSERLDGTHARVAVGALKIGQIAAERRPLYLAEVATEPRIVDKAWVAEHGIVAFAGYPLVFRGEELGVLAMFSRRLLGPDELDRLGMFAAQASVAIANARLHTQVTRLSRRLEAENAYLREELRRPIIGTAPPLQKALHALAQVAPTKTTVLLLGETGTGKELFARALHELSPRRDHALVTVNCAALAPTLIESELFGHEKGAFTGALQRRIGRFELAHGGTLFLDELGELAPEAQAKLLRVLQERRFERVGGVETIHVDIRIVAATNRDLVAEVSAGRFRADLYYRLSMFSLPIPPLRERREDIPALLQHHAIEPDALVYLQGYDWPGNVRELFNVVERAAIFAEGRPIRIADLPELRNVVERRGVADSLKASVDAYEKQLIADAMAQASGNQSEAARLLRMSRATLQYKLKVHGL